MLGGVHVYREPFLLPTENLPVGLGDTSRHSESRGLQGESGEQQGLRRDLGLCSHRQLPSHGLVRSVARLLTWDGDDGSDKEFVGQVSRQ